MTSAIVVGSGPNGLAAAITLAQRGIDVTLIEAADTVGGGLATSENTLPGLLHDDCAAVVPTAVMSPFIRTLDLESYGLQWAWPEVDLAHPLDGGRAGVMVRSLDETERLMARLKMAEIPRNGNPTRVRNRCELTGRPRGYYRKFRLCRVQLRDLANKGLIPGVTKSSW